MNRLEDLHLFLRVMDLGSISAAARSLDLSPAVASARLRRLEKSLGTRLLNRTTRRLSVTPEGAALAEQGRPLILDLQSLTDALQQSARGVSGSLRVSAPASFGRRYISPLLPEFLARHPRLKLHLDLSDRMTDLVREGYDLAIRIGQLHDSSLVARRLAANQRVLCASPDYIRRRGAPATPDDLAHHDCLLLVGAKAPYDVWRLKAPDGREIAVRVRGRLESNLGDVTHDAALAGLGIAQYSMWHITEDLRAGRLQIVLPDYRLPESAFYALTPQRRLTPPRVRAFVDFLSARLSAISAAYASSS